MVGSESQNQCKIQKKISPRLFPWKLSLAVSSATADVCSLEHVSTGAAPTSGDGDICHLKGGMAQSTQVATQLLGVGDIATRGSIWSMILMGFTTWRATLQRDYQV